MRNALRCTRYIAALAVVALLASGCGSGVQFVRQDMTEYPPKDTSAKIAVFDGAITRPHVVSGTMTLDKKIKASFDDTSTYDDVLDEMVAYARQVGADALVRVRPVMDDKTITSRVTLTATAVRYLRENSVVTSN
jgi:hypothetical protein